MMKLLSVEYIKGVPRWEDGPRDGLPEIAFIGRSNVGKSSLINFLLGRKVAYVSGTPGKTQLIHFYKIATKGDKVPRGKRKGQEESIKENFGISTVIVTSAEKKEGREALWKGIEGVLSEGPRRTERA
jgi:GTP-binding protein EngB required for normal cell division